MLVNLLSWWRRGTVACRVGRGLVAVVALAGVLVAGTQAEAQPAAAALQTRYAELLPQLRGSVFGAPLVLSSRQSGDRVSGDVYAEVEHDFGRIAAALATPAAVCDLLLLHLNVHGCTPEAPGSSEVLILVVGPKRASAVEPSYHMRYRLRTEAATPGYLRVLLDAARGPLSTRDYRILFEAIPLDGGRSFVHLDYAYHTGLVARLAMGAYLATAGRDKIGFTVVGRYADGRPIHVRGERGALERNVLRYYLALLAVCSASSQPPQAQAEARLRIWFSLTERYAAQLHELEWDEYLLEKRADLARALRPLR